MCVCVCVCACRALLIKSKLISHLMYRLGTPQALPILWPNRTAGAHLERLGVEFDKEEKPLRGPIVSGASI